jgi:hypothetical protein
MLLVACGASLLGGSRRKRFFQEDGVVESFQAWHLIIATMLFSAGAAVVGRRGRLEAWFLGGMAAMTLWAVNREFDFLWKHNGLGGEYQVCKGLIAAVGAGIAVVKFRALLDAWRADPLRPVFLCVYLGVGGYAGAQVVSTIVDLIGTPRYVHRATQESIELLASAFFVFGALEALRRIRWLDGPRCFRVRREAGVRLAAAPARTEEPELVGAGGPRSGH